MCKIFCAWRAFAALALAAPLWPVHALAVPEEALDALERMAVHDPARAQEKIDTLLAANPDLDEHARLHATVVRMMIADAQRRPDDVLAISDSARDALRTSNDARLLVRLESTRVGAMYLLGRFEEGWSELDDELKYARQSNDGDLVAQALVDRAGFMIKRARFEPAAVAISEAEESAHGAQAVAEVAFSNALLAKEIGDWSQTLAAFENALAKFKAVGDRTGQADSLAVIGEALVELDRCAEAIEPLAQATATYRSVGDRDGESGTLRTEARAYAGLHEADLALSVNGRALDLASHQHDPNLLALIELDRAGLLTAQKRPRDALALVKEARPVALAQEDLQLKKLLYRVAASTYAALKQYDRAYEEQMRLYDVERQRTEQLVAHQLAAQRGRLESQRLARENTLLREKSTSAELALAEANRAARLQAIALALGGFIVLLSLIGFLRQRALMRRIARMAQTDDLTGVLNRRHFLELGQRIIQRCRRDGAACALLMLDVDRFKDINDRYGHLAGDEALRSISRAMQACLRPGDVIGRYGGEEFALILPGADAREAGDVAERLRNTVASLTPAWAPNAIPLTISGGIAIDSDHNVEFTELLVRADAALYRAKDAGRNRMEYDRSDTPSRLPLPEGSVPAT